MKILGTRRNANPINRGRLQYCTVLKYYPNAAQERARAEVTWRYDVARLIQSTSTSNPPSQSSSRRRSRPRSPRPRPRTSNPPSRTRVVGLVELPSVAGSRNEITQRAAEGESAHRSHQATVGSGCDVSSTCYLRHISKIPGLDQNIGSRRGGERS